jgi:hypothetical protein
MNKGKLPKKEVQLANKHTQMVNFFRSQEMQKEIKYYFMFIKLTN